MPNHRKAVDELVEIHSADPDNLALIIIGSMARGSLRPDSDVDLYLVVTESKYRQIRAKGSTFLGNWDSGRFGGAEIDGKVMSKGFLRAAAEKGSEPTRASFERSYAEFCRDPEIETLIQSIPVYQEAERDPKLRTFYALTKHYRYVGVEAFELGNPLWARRCLLNLVFFAHRLALAHNRVLFPCEKALLDRVRSCLELPEGFVSAAESLVDRVGEPDVWARAIEFYDLVAGFFGDYGLEDTGRIGMILDLEMSWYSGRPDPFNW